MSKQDPIAEALSDLLDEPLSPRELARASESIAAAEARAALGVRQALKDLGPDGEFVAQLEAQLLAGVSHADGAKPNVAPLAWLRRIGLPAPDTQTAPTRRRRLVLVLSGITSLLVLAFAAVILIPLLGGKEPMSHDLGSPVWNPTGVNGGLSGYVLSDTISVLPSAPSHVPLFSYSPQTGDAGTTRRVADLARSLGLRDPFTVTVDQSATYTATDGTRMVSVRGDVISYADSSVQARGVQLNTGKSLAEGLELVERFLKSCGFLDFPYFATTQGNGDTPAVVTFTFVRLADGWPVQNESMSYDARATVIGNSIADARFISHTLEPAGEAAILSAEEALQALRQNQLLSLRLFTAAGFQQVIKAVAPLPSWPSPMAVALPVDADGKVNGVEGRLSAIIWETEGVVSSSQSISASISGGYSVTQPKSTWRMELIGPQVRDLARLDGLRVKVWGRYDAASQTTTVERFEQADPTERVQAWLGTVTNTVTADGIMRSFFITNDGRRFILSASLPCESRQTVCILNAPIDRIVIMEGAVGQETEQGVPVLYFLGLGGGKTDMTEQDLKNNLSPRPHVNHVAAAAAAPTPAPTAVRSHTPPYKQGDRVEGVEGYLHAWLSQDALGQIVDVKAELSVLPLTGNTWGASLREDGLHTSLRELAQYDSLRMRLWGTFTHDEHDQPMIIVDRYEKVDPAEKVQAWLGRLVTGTVEGRTVILLQTREGEKWILAGSLLAPESAFTFAVEPQWSKQVVQEGVIRPESFGGYRVIQNGVLRAGIAIDRMTDLKDYQMQPHPFVFSPDKSAPSAIAIPPPTVVPTFTPPYQPGDRVEGVEGYLNAVLYQDAMGQIVDVKAELSMLPLTGNDWSARLNGSLMFLRELAKYDRLRVRLWGYFTRDVNGQALINVERYEKVDPGEHWDAWLGNLITGTVEGRTVVLIQTAEGEHFILALRSMLLSPTNGYDESHWPPLENRVVQEGVLRPERYGGYRIIQDGVQTAGTDVDHMTDLKDYQMQRHPQVMLVDNPAHTATVEQVELIYYSDVSPGSTTGTVMLRPAWRFWGNVSDGGSFEALVDAVRPDTTRVTLDVFSGRPNPTWTLSSAATSELKGLLANAALTPTTAAPLADGALGYRGMLIDLTDATTGATQHFRAFKGVVAGQDAAGADPLRRLERWLLRSGVGWFDSDLYAQLSQEIDAVLPQVWQDAAPVSDLSENSSSPYIPKRYQLSNATFYLILVNGLPVALSTKDPHPRGCPIYWDEQRQRMVEPCLGSEYEGNGAYVAGPSMHDMVRFPARLNGARIEVDVTRPIEGTFRGQRQADSVNILGVTPAPTAIPAAMP